MPLHLLKPLYLSQYDVNLTFEASSEKLRSCLFNDTHNILVVGQRENLHYVELRQWYGHCDIVSLLMRPPVNLEVNICGVEFTGSPGCCTRDEPNHIRKTDTV